MAKLSIEQIDEIAENISMGMLCFYYIPSGKIISLPSDVIDVNPENSALYSEEELRDRKMLDNIEARLNQYISFEKMSSRNAFDTMHSFALSVDHETIKENLLLSLKKTHPFQSFKEALHALPEEIVKGWYAFNNRKSRRWVEEQLELYDF